MKIEFQIIKEEQLLIQKFCGEFSAEYYFQYTRYLAENFELQSIKKVLIDFRKLEFSYVLTDFKERMSKILDFRKELNNNEVKRNEVLRIFWVDKPISTVIAQIFKDVFSDKNYNYCSTKSMVLMHLNISEKFDLESIINDLEHTFKI